VSEALVRLEKDQSAVLVMLYMLLE